MDSFRQQLLVTLLVAALAPLIAELRLFRPRIPVVVVEIALGILIGPHALNLARPDGMINALGDLGLTFLLFLVGLEIDIGEIKGRPITLAVSGWLLSLALALVGALVFSLIGLFRAPPLWVAVALSTTALGIIAPILRDRGELDSHFGHYLFAAATLGEMGPLIAISLLLFPTHAPLLHSLLMAAFVAISLAAAYLILWARSSRLLHRVPHLLHGSGQLAVRLAIVLQTLLVVLAEQFGLNVVIGAFAAGMMVALIVQDEGGALLRQKLDAIGFGFLIPIFFVVAGMKFDVRALWASPLVPVQLVVLLASLVLVRGAPALLYRRDLSIRERLAFALYSATGLPLIVVITELGVSTGLMQPDRAALLVSAGMISVLVFPLAAERWRNGAG
ncbi:cation:proton antiporter [Candidatus Methylocalor cossyra]|uniref:Cation:proton antiporter n=1 Tax=Candidatus Methylocalor cossyra TaxID=3108543 RepID=A0ABP1C7M4_9GAMM